LTVIYFTKYTLCDYLRYKLSMHITRSVMKLMDEIPNAKSINGNFGFLHSDIELASTLNPFTHVYMFDKGFPGELHYSIAQKFNASLYVTHLISYRPPRDIIGIFQFQVEYLHQFNTRMHG